MKQILAIFMLICSYVLCNAQATTLEIDNKVAGTLSQRLLYEDKLSVENLIISGVLNGDDLKFIQELNASYNLHGTLDVSEVNIVGNYDFGNGSYAIIDNSINVKTFQTSNRLNKLILPKSATKWTESVWFSSSAGTTHLNVDSLIIIDPKYKEIGGIGNPSYLYIGEGVECFYMNNSEGGSEYSGNIEFNLPSTLKGLYITSLKVGKPDYITIHAEMQTIPTGYGMDPTKEELTFFSRGIIYVPEGTKDVYKHSMFQNLEIIAPVSVTGIVLNQSEVNLLVGDNFKLEATIYPIDADEKNIIWHSSDTTIATVDDNGFITAKRDGVATITAISAGNPDIISECVITVIQPASGIELNKTTLDLVEGESEQLFANILPSNATNKKHSWGSSDISVAMVSSNGTVYAVKPGQATVMATSEDGDFVALCKVSVKAKTVIASTIQITPQSYTLAIGDTLQLSATLTPENTSDKALSWTSTNPAIASVNSHGLVKALSEGKTQIIATTTDGSNLSAICVITIEKQFVYISQIQIEPSKVSLPIGESVTLTASIAPENASSKSISWSSTNPSVAVITQDGVVQGISEGEAIIIASTKDGSNLSATCQISVSNDIVLISEITLNPQLIEGEEDDSVIIDVSILPENATNKQLKWYSSNEDVAVVTEGVVKLKKKGTAIITAESLDNSNVKSHCTVVVSENNGIESIKNDMNTHVMIFNLSGTLIYEGPYSEAKITSGFYIIMHDGKIIKTILNN